MSERLLQVLSIGGSDPSGGAGIQADLKTFSAMGVYGMTAITAVTVQNTLGVSRVEVMSPSLVAEQIDAVFSDMNVDAIKVGLLPNHQIVEAVAERLEHYQHDRVVLDPVMVSATGAKLIEDDAKDAIVKRLFPLARVVTPNVDEASLLTGKKIENRKEVEEASHAIIAMGANAVLLKGGHLRGDTVYDHFLTAIEIKENLRVRTDEWLTCPRIETKNLHGAGCTLSSAIAANLAVNSDLERAVEKGRRFVRVALASGAQLTLGHGVGPLNHLAEVRDGIII